MATDLDRDDPGRTMRVSHPGEATVAPTAIPTRAAGRRAAIASGVVVLVLAVIIGAVLSLRSGAEPGPEPPPTAGPATTAGTASESAPTRTETTPPTAAQVAVARAEATYARYLRVSDQVAAAGYGGDSAFKSVAVGDALNQSQLATKNYRIAGIKQVGRPKLASQEAHSVALATNAGAVPEVVLKVCLDVTGFDLVRNGKSVIAPHGPDRLGSVVTVRNYPKRGGWLVASIAAKGGSC